MEELLRQEFERLRFVELEEEFVVAFAKAALRCCFTREELPL